MARKVFFSFHHANDIWEVNQVRNAWRLPGFRETQPIIDAAEFEKIKRQGEQQIKNWIDRQMAGCGVLAVLIGPQTYQRKWVLYEIEKAHREKKGLLGISLQGMKSRSGWETKSAGPNPFYYANLGNIFQRPEVPIYNWKYNYGARNIGSWVETAARAVGR